MWSNLNLSTIQDFASKQVQQVTTVGSNLVNTAQESLRKISSDRDGEDEVNQTNDHCPNINNSDETSETIKNVTIKADQIADSFFNYASTFAGQALNTTQNVVNQTRVLATKANEKANEAVAQISENQTFKHTLNQVQTKIDNTILGDFNNYQKSFIEKKDSSNDDISLPWEGYENSYELKDKILQLSMDKRTFVRPPPAGILFNFNYSDVSMVALKLLEKDSNLNKMRFDLVPKKLKEEIFWKNYFYRVSLVKQSYQIKSLQRSNSSSKVSLETTELSDLPGTINNNGTKNERKESTFHDVNIDDNFASNDFNDEISATDLEAEMAALGMDGGGDADWEKELEAELDEYEILDQETPKDMEKPSSLKDDSSWEKEMDDMLN